MIPAAAALHLVGLLAASFGSATVSASPTAEAAAVAEAAQPNSGGLNIVNGDRHFVCRMSEFYPDTALSPTLAHFSTGTPDGKTLAAIGYKIPTVQCDGLALNKGLYHVDGKQAMYTPAYEKNGVWYPCPPQQAWYWTEGPDGTLAWFHYSNCELKNV